MTTAGPEPGAGSWPDEILKQELANPRLALAVLQLYLNSYKWIHHRLHQITFLDETTVRQCFTVDLTVSTHAPTLQAHRIGTARLLPIDLLHKQNLVNFDIKDQENRSLSYFTRSQLGIMTTTMLVEYAGGFLDEPLPHDIRRYFSELVFSDAKDTEDKRDVWRAAVREGPKALEYLETKEEFNLILKLLTDNFVLLIPIKAEPGTRLKVTYCLDLPLGDYIQDPRTKWKRWCEQLGWRETSIDFPLRAAADTENYNFEVEDPPGVDLYQAAIVEYPAVTSPARGGQARPKRILHDWQLGGVARLNLHARGVQRSSVAVAHVDIEDSREEFWLRAFIITAFVLGVLLLLGAWRLPRMLVEEQVSGANEVAATLLLFLAGVIATVLMTSDPRGLLRRLLSRLRQLATLTAALPIAAVGVLLYASHSWPLLRLAWSVLGLTALLAAVVAFLSYRLPKAPQKPPSINRR